MCLCVRPFTVFMCPLCADTLFSFHEFNCCVVCAFYCVCLCFRFIVWLSAFLLSVFRVLFSLPVCCVYVFVVRCYLDGSGLILIVLCDVFLLMVQRSCL